jgi:hypothetical protein
VTFAELACAGPAAVAFACLGLRSRDAGWRQVPHEHVTSSWVTGLDLFGSAMRPEQRLETEMTHFLSSWTGMTQAYKFEDR